MSGVSQFLLFAFALIVLFYWFRYNCAVVLHRKISLENAKHVAAANQLTFAEMEERVDDLEAAELSEADKRLSREYEVLVCLLRYTSPVQPPVFTFDQRLLMTDFAVQRWWFGLTSRWLAAPARQSLHERIRILTHFAHLVGKRTAVLSRA